MKSYNITLIQNDGTEITLCQFPLFNKEEINTIFQDLAYTLNECEELTAWKENTKSKYVHLLTVERRKGIICQQVSRGNKTHYKRWGKDSGRHIEAPYNKSV